MKKGNKIAVRLSNGIYEYGTVEKVVDNVNYLIRSIYYIDQYNNFKTINAEFVLTKAELQNERIGINRVLSLMEGEEGFEQ